MQLPALRIVLVALVFCAALSAAPILGGGSFEPFGSNPNQNGFPFWDNLSADGGGCGAGYILTQTASIGSCANKRMGTNTGLGLDAGDLEYYSAAGNSVAFTLAAGAYEFTLDAGLYGARLNEIGYTYLNGGGDHLIFSTANTVGDSFNLTATGEFALWIKSDGNLSFVYLSNDASAPRAAAFRDTSSGVYFFGFEDRAQGDRDYNDMFISANYTQTPEPATFALMGLGLIAIALVGRRKRKS